ncbi:PucR family transcriptional regulator [Jatrophihabitans sp. YIM 134969]
MAVEDDLRLLADGVGAQMSALTRTIARRLREEVPEYYERDDPVLGAAETDAIAASLRDVLDGLVEGRIPPDRASDSILREARLAAQADIDLHALLRTSRVGQAAMWDSFLQVSNDLIPDAGRRLAALRRASQYHFAWNDRVAESIIDTYEKERNLFYFQGRDRKRRAILRDLLAGIPVDEAALGYPLQGRHLGIVVWGDAPETVIKQLSAGPGRRTLTVAGTGDTTLGWVSWPGSPSSAQDAVASLSLPPDTFIACGEPANDADGMRLSHRQAWQAYRVARIRTQPITRYRRVALEALVLRDIPAARDFVKRELGPLSDSSERSVILRDTLRAYFASGQNAASTASVIGVHERTVAYRLRSVESLLSVSVATARDDLSVALRLFDLLGDDTNDLDLPLHDDGPLTGTTF